MYSNPSPSASNNSESNVGTEAAMSQATENQQQGIVVSLGMIVHDGTGNDGPVIRMTPKVCYLTDLGTGRLIPATYEQLHVDGAAIPEDYDIPAETPLLCSENEDEGNYLQTIDGGDGDALILYRNTKGQKKTTLFKWMMMPAAGPNPDQVEEHTRADDYAMSLLDGHHLAALDMKFWGILGELSKAHEHYPVELLNHDDRFISVIHDELEDLRVKLFHYVGRLEQRVVASAVGKVAYK